MFIPEEAGEEVEIERGAEAERLIAGWRERIGRGERIDPAETERADPELAARLREGLATLERLERAFAGGTAPSPDSLVGSVLGPYRVLARLGSGGMGDVWLAEDGDSRVAIKVLRPHLLERPGFLARFRREAEVGTRIRHANVVATYCCDSLLSRESRSDFLVMEYVEGQTLRSLLAELDRVPEELCRHIGREVARGLAAIHAAGVVHRDLKPENVIVTKDHVVKVMDLGVALLVDEAARLSQTGVFVGSIHYAAPEQFRRGGRNVDARADLHALGLVLYELSTGTHPYPAEDFHDVLRRLIEEQPRRAAEVNPQLSPFFEELVHKLLAKDPDDRFASAAEVAQVLEEGEKSAWWSRRALEVRAETSRPLRRIRIPRETALYGRNTELARLRAVFDRATVGDGQVVLIEGEAGIGKSRLIDEFVGLLHQQGHDFNFLFGGNAPGGAATASGAFTTAYREQFGDEGLATTLAAYLPQTPILVPAFAALLRGEPPPKDQEPLTKDSLQTVFVHATRALAAERTTIVLIDDLHFAPEEGRALFAALAMAVPGHRVLLVGTARPGIDEKWLANLDRLDQTSRMPLARLSPKDLARLLVDAFHSQRLAEELSFKIAAKSDGNPYFVFEILRGLRDGQFIAKQPDGTWVTTRIIADIEVPSTVKDLVFARIASLPTEERNLLDVAACAGFEFDPVLVGEVLGLARVPSLQRLAAIEKSHRLVRSAGRRFVFDHHQVAEVLYAALPEMLREHYHASIAEAMETRHGAAERDPKSIDGALCLDLAEHFLKGAKGPRASRYLDAAMTHLEKGYLNEAAVRLAHRALEVPGLLAGKDRCKLLLRKADGLANLGRADDERSSLDEAVRLVDIAGEPGLRARARDALGWHLERVGRPDEALEVLREAVTLARVADDQQAEASATGRLGSALGELSRSEEARAHHDRHLALSRKLGCRRGEAAAIGDLGNLFHDLGEFDAARGHHERSLALAHEIGDRRSELAASGNLASALHGTGRYDEARTHYEHALRLARELGNRRAESNGNGNFANLLMDLGRYDEARMHLERYIAVAREIGDRKGDAVGNGNLAHLLQGLGRANEAQAHARHALTLAREIGHRYGEGFWLNIVAELAADVGNAEEAELRFAEAFELRQRIGHADGAAVTLVEWGGFLARLGRTTEAGARLAQALAIAQRVDDATPRIRAAAHLAALPGGDAGPALEAFEAQQSRIDHGSKMQARVLLWQATRDPAHLIEAKRLLDHLVAHAPADCRETMLSNVRLHREITAAATEEGL